MTDVIKIPLTQGKFALVDKLDESLISPHKWFANRQGNTYYAGRNITDKPYIQTFISMHRLILGLKKGETADHINGDGLDNRRSNLRKCTIQQNTFNKHRTKKGSSQYKGVCWQKQARKWRAYIKKDYKGIYLGLYESEVDAAKAYNKAAIKHFGEYANLNNTSQNLVSPKPKIKFTRFPLIGMPND